MKQDNTTKAIISAIILVMGIFGQSAQKPQDNVGNNNVDSILNEVNLAFDLAEKNILKSKHYIPDDNVECSCNGTGVIVHGDGHETPCPCEVCECEAPPTTPPEEDCTPVFQRGLLRRLFKR